MAWSERCTDGWGGKIEQTQGPWAGHIFDTRLEHTKSMHIARWMHPDVPVSLLMDGARHHHLARKVSYGSYHALIEAMDSSLDR